MTKNQIKQLEKNQFPLAKLEVLAALNLTPAQLDELHLALELPPLEMYSKEVFNQISKLWLDATRGQSSTVSDHLAELIVNSLSSQFQQLLIQYPELVDVAASRAFAALIKSKKLKQKSVNFTRPKLLMSSHPPNF